MKANVLDPRERLVRRFTSVRGNSDPELMEILSYAQDVFGYVDSDVLQMVSRYAHAPIGNLLRVFGSSAEFRRPRAGRATVVVCVGHSCREKGSDALLKEIESYCSGSCMDLNIAKSRCIGCCQQAPAVVENGKVQGRMSVQRMDRDLMRLAQGVLDVPS